MVGERAAGQETEGSEWQSGQAKVARTVVPVSAH